MSGGRFQTLIPDILSQVFLEYLLNNSEQHPNPHIADAPLIFGRVCSHWRQVAEGTPPLWSRLKITIEDPEDEDGRMLTASNSRYAKMTRMFMTRSCNRPLSIALYCSSSKTSKHLNLVTEVLLRHAPRWKSLELSTGLFTIHCFLTALQNGVPLLQTLKVHAPDWNGWNYRFGDLELLHAPRLSHLEAYNSILRLKTPHTPISNIRYLAVTENIHGLFQWIMHCPCIEELSGYIELVPEKSDSASSAHVSTDDYHHSRIVHELPHLTALTLRSGSGWDEEDERTTHPACSFLDQCRTPALQSLHLAVDADGYRDRFGSHVRGFLQRSFPSLLSLKLSLSCVFPDYVEGILAVVPSLQDLELNGGLVTKLVVKALTMTRTDKVSGTGNSVCPLLRRLKLHMAIGMLEAPVIDMIVSRFPPLSDSSMQTDGARGSIVTHDTTRSAAVSRTEEIEIIWSHPPRRLLSEHPAIAACITQGLRVREESRLE